MAAGRDPDRDDQQKAEERDDIRDELDDEFDDEEEPPSEYWPAADLLKGATVIDAELELSYSASVYVNTPAAQLRLWLRFPDGQHRLVQVDEPQAIWLYRQVAGGGERELEEYPDHRFELPSTDLRVLRARQRRQLIDRQAQLQAELMSLGEELDELDRDMRDDEEATLGWPGTSWP